MIGNTNEVKKSKAELQCIYPCLWIKLIQFYKNYFFSLCLRFGSSVFNWFNLERALSGLMPFIFYFLTWLYIWFWMQKCFRELKCWILCGFCMHTNNQPLNWTLKLDNIAIRLCQNNLSTSIIIQKLWNEKSLSAVLTTKVHFF